VHPKRQANPKAKRPSFKDKEMDWLVEACWGQGWWCERGTKFIEAFTPDGKSMIPIPGTSSDFRSFTNTRAQLRRAGLDI
jgi:hypothetical protein